MLETTTSIGSVNGRHCIQISRRLVDDSQYPFDKGERVRVKICAGYLVIEKDI